MGIVLGNNVASLLAADISDSGLLLTVTAGEGVLFPDPAPGDYFYCTLVDTDGNMEIIRVTARATDVLTIVRAQESTLAKAFNTGARIELRITAQSILDVVDTAVDGVTLTDLGVTASTAELNKLAGVTASTAELNKLAGLTSTTAELNKLTGATASTAELNRLTGLTASTAELNKLAGVTASTAEINKLTGLTASTAELNSLAGLSATVTELNVLAGMTASTAELNKLDNVTVSTAEINHLAGVTSNIQTQINSFATFPAGVVIAYGGSAAPTGWLLCQGQAINRTTYATLFAVVGTSFGAGNGSTTFNVPDLRGRVVAGKDDMGGSAANRLTGTSGGVNGVTLGASGGTETHVMTTSEMPLHGHPWYSTFNVQSTFSSKSTGGFPHATLSAALRNAFTGTPSATQGEQIGGSGGGAAHNNVQPTLIMNYIIKT